MGRCIVKIKDRYLEWSTIVDAPVTYGMTEEGLSEYILEEYGKHGMEELPARLKRVERTGTSFIPRTTLEELIVGNRAGENGTTLTLDEIYSKYCLQEEDSAQ